MAGSKEGLGDGEGEPASPRPHALPATSESRSRGSPPLLDPATVPDCLPRPLTTTPGAGGEGASSSVAALAGAPMGSGMLSSIGLQSAVPAAVLTSLHNADAQTRANTAALSNYAARVWRISNWWRSPPQSNRPTNPDGTYVKPKLLIVYSDTGGGHKASAASISAALEHIAPGEVEVKAVDVIEDYSLWASHRTYNWFISMPWLWGTIYNSTKATHSLSGDVYLLDPARTLEPYILQGFIRCVQEERPDVIVSVHPILQSAPRATSSHVINGRQVPFVTVVTDLGEAHPWWFNRGVAKLFVPTPDMKAQAVNVGVPEEAILVCGLPLRQMFWHMDTTAERKERVRAVLGLDPVRPAVLVMGGGDGMGKLRECALSFFNALAEEAALCPEASAALPSSCLQVA